MCIFENCNLENFVCVTMEQYQKVYRNYIKEFCKITVNDDLSLDFDIKDEYNESFHSNAETLILKYLNWLNLW